MTRVVLDQGTKAWLARIEQITARLAASDARPDDHRELMRRVSDELFSEFGVPVDDAVEVLDHTVPVGGGTIRVRQYRPAGASGPIPAYLLMHGGAFSHGSIDEAFNRARATQRAVEADVAVFDVDYRLAPEHPFPTALEDAYATLAWVHENRVALQVDAARVVVGGESAGGNLAAALGQLARDRGGPAIVGQILEVPVLDLREGVVWQADHAAANNITVPADLQALYGPGVSPDSPYFSPAAGELAGLPPTHVITAEYDPLTPTTEQYVEDLRQAGVEVSATRHLGMLHGSASVTARVRGARLWAAEVCLVLREMTAG